MRASSLNPLLIGAGSRTLETTRAKRIRRHSLNPHLIGAGSRTDLAETVARVDSLNPLLIGAGSRTDGKNILNWAALGLNPLLIGAGSRTPWLRRPR